MKLLMAFDSFKGTLTSLEAGNIACDAAQAVGGVGHDEYVDAAREIPEHVVGAASDEDARTAAGRTTDGFALYAKQAFVAQRVAVEIAAGADQWGDGAQYGAEEALSLIVSFEEFGIKSAFLGRQA